MTTFAQWITVQAGRNDAIGDLGNDVKHDKDIPAGIPNRYANWWSYLRGRTNDTIVLLTLRLAWLEYRAIPKPHRETVEATAPYEICALCAAPIGIELDTFDRDDQRICMSCYFEEEPESIGE
jgi:hypothetical protein